VVQQTARAEAVRERLLSAFDCRMKASGRERGLAFTWKNACDEIFPNGDAYNEEGKSIRKGASMSTLVRFKNSKCKLSHLNVQHKTWLLSIETWANKQLEHLSGKLNPTYVVVGNPF
jgi:hypothetical protein